MQTRIGIAALPPTPETLTRAEQLGCELGLPVVSVDQSDVELQLVVTPQRLELRESGTKIGPVFVDFSGGRMRIRRHGGGMARDPLIRAVGMKAAQPYRVLDATAGLGRDSFVLALAGCDVVAIERCGVMAALLSDGLRRAADDVDLQTVVGRISLMPGDAREVLDQLPESQYPDAVYIDPMFPHRAKSAASKKEMLLARRVAGEDLDADALLAVARKVARQRVVVKRWLHAPPLAPSPAIQYKGQSVRFDVYLAALGPASGRD